MLYEKPTTSSGRTSTVSTETVDQVKPTEPITVADSVFGTDPPIEKAHPGLQPALVFASYPLILIVVIAIVAIYFMFGHSSPTREETPANQTNSPPKNLTDETPSNAPKNE